MMPQRIIRLAPAQLKLLTFITAAISIFATTVYLYKPHTIHLTMADNVCGRDSISSTNSSQASSIFFMKTHKTGSSAVQNIFMRYAICNGLTVATGTGDDYSRLCIGKLFHRDCVRDRRKLPYDIIAHHLRFNEPEIVASVKPDAKYISIIRDPNELIPSAFTYFQWDMRLPTKNITEFVKRYKEFSFDEEIGLPYKNLMMYVFGLEVKDFENDARIKQKLQKIEDRFDLIMINEYMFPSLILLKELLNWSYEDVAVFHLNMQVTQKSAKLDLDGINKLRKTNRADQMLYDRFYYLFKLKVREYGEDKMMVEEKRLKQTVDKLQKECLGATKTSKWNKDVILKKYELSDFGKNNKQCQFMVKDELSFTRLFMR